MGMSVMRNWRRTLSTAVVTATFASSAFVAAALGSVSARAQTAEAQSMVERGGAFADASGFESPLVGSFLDDDFYGDFGDDFVEDRFFEDRAFNAIAAGPPVDEPIVEAVGERSYLFFGAGYDDLRDYNGSSVGFVIEGAGKQLFDITFRSLGDTVLRMRPRAATEFSTDGDFYIGAGLSLEVFPFSWPVFFEVSFLPGVYRRPDEFYPVVFRTQLGGGYMFDNGHTVTVTVSHKSNNHWGPEGSSVETFLVRYGVPFSIFH